MQVDYEIAAQCCEFAKQTKLLVAYSGGVDSHVLLHALAQYLKTVPTLSLRAIHVNHQLHPCSTDWALHCQQVCLDLSLPIEIVVVDVQAQSGESTEALARKARYAAICQHMLPGEIVMMAQHQDDQAETLLLQLMRGSGVKGLAAMPLMRDLGCGRLMRPLLQVSQQDIMVYAQQHQLSWQDDPSNSDTQFDRNYLRLHVMPMLKQRWPQCASTIARSARHCAAADADIQAAVVVDFGYCFHPVDLTLAVATLRRLSTWRCQQVIRYWIQQQDFILPDSKHLHQIMLMLEARHDAQACVHYKGVEVRRHGDCLYVMSRLIQHDVEAVYHWDLSTDLTLPGDLGILTLTVLKPLLGSRDVDCLTVRFRQGGEKIKLPGKNVSRTLKNYFNEWGVPPWQRDRVPLLYDGDQIVMVWGYTDFLMISEESDNVRK